MRLGLTRATGAIAAESLAALKLSARNRSPVHGFTHCFYKYPARFSPHFVASVIEQFSRPGQVVLDPYMGGGTTVVEAYARGRIAIGCDLNSLAVFVAQSKTTELDRRDRDLILRWVVDVVPSLSYRISSADLVDLICPYRSRNLSIPRARPAKKLIALALLSIRELRSETAQRFARAVLLSVAQWALNNRKSMPTLPQLRSRIAARCADMLAGADELSTSARNIANASPPILIHGSASDLPKEVPFASGTRADLVVTSPPYPGIHILYHRWQVDGRKETPAPYWIADCYDGMGSAYYNFADRKQHHEEQYFEESLKTLRSIHSVMNVGATIVQMVAFSNPRRQLPRYLQNMQSAGFTEIKEVDHGNKVAAFRRIWRHVPSRAWYAAQKGKTNSSSEVVLIHKVEG